MRRAPGLLVVALLAGPALARGDEAIAEPPPPTALSRSWLVPAVETLTLDLAIWGIARVTNGTRSPDWSIQWPDVVTRYPMRSWQFDLDDFDTNQFLHAYHGASIFTAARSSGLGFWESALFPLLGSLLWELFLETQHPSVNDQITTALGGVFLGEALFRSSDMLLHGGGTPPDALRQAGSFLVAPVAGFNRLVFGYPSDVERPIAALSVFSAGAGSGWAAPSPGAESRTGVQGAAAIQVSQVGVDGWRARRPFEHFDLSLGFAAGSGASVTGGATGAEWYLFVEGLLVPGRIDGGERLQGLWGLFGGYDYDEPGVLRVSTSTLGLGATGEWRLPGASLQGTVVASWAVLANSDAMGAPVAPQSYKVGPSGQLLVDARMILGDRARVRLWAREYVLAIPVHGSGWEEITRGSASVLLRILGPHGVTVEGEIASRHGHHPGVPGDVQRAAFVRLLYTLVTDEGLGAVLRQPP